MPGTASPPRSWLASLAGGGPRSVLALVVIAFLSFLPGFVSLPPIDRDEARFAQSSRQMVTTGDWIDVRFRDEPRYKQPVGIYWLQSIVVSALDDDGIAPIWMHRLPSLLAAIAAVLLTYWIALALVSREAAFLAAATMAVTILLGVEARLAKTDATLLATILVAQGVLARAWLSARGHLAETAQAWRPWLYPALFWTALAAGIIVKGPIIILHVGLTVAALAAVDRSVAFLRPLRPVLGLIWCAALAAPWYVAIGLRTDGAFYQTAIGFSVAGKIARSHEGHGAPPLTHAAWFWAVFWPGALIFALSIGQIWRRRREPWLTFLFCWAIPPWIVLELVTTKLPHYILPELPAVAIATAGIVLSHPSPFGGRVWRFALTLVMALVTVGAIAVVIAVAWFAGPQEITARLVVFATLAIVLIGGAFVFARRAMTAGDPWRFAAALLASMIAFYWLLYPSLARIDAIWPARTLGRVVADYDGCRVPLLVAAGYDEPSLVFNTRPDLVITGGATAADRLAEARCGLALIEGRHRQAFDARAGALGLAHRPIATVSGYNLGGGRLIEVTVFERLRPAGR